jgi:hypothetical protein
VQLCCEDHRHIVPPIDQAIDVDQAEVTRRQAGRDEKLPILLGVLIFAAIRKVDRLPIGLGHEAIMHAAKMTASAAVIGPNSCEPFGGLGARSGPCIERVVGRGQREQILDRPSDALRHRLERFIIKHRWPPP